MKEEFSLEKIRTTILDKFQQQLSLYRMQHAHLVNESKVRDGIKVLMDRNQTSFILAISTDLWEIEDSASSVTFMEIEFVEFCNPITQVNSFILKNLKEKDVRLHDEEMEVPSLAA